MHPVFVITLYYDLPVLDGPAQHVSQLHRVIQTPHYNKAVIHEGETSFRFIEKFRRRCWDFLYIPCIHTISPSILRFTAKLSTRYRFLYSPWPCIASLIINISHWISTLVATGESESEVAQSCPTLSDPMHCSLPGSSVHGIFQARVLERGAIIEPVLLLSGIISDFFIIIFPASVTMPGSWYVFSIYFLSHKG